MKNELCSRKLRIGIIVCALSMLVSGCADRAQNDSEKQTALMTEAEQATETEMDSQGMSGGLDGTHLEYSINNRTRIDADIVYHGKTDTAEVITAGWKKINPEFVTDMSPGTTMDDWTYQTVQEGKSLYESYEYDGKSIKVGYSIGYISPEWSWYSLYGPMVWNNSTTRLQWKDQDIDFDFCSIADAHEICREILENAGYEGVEFRNNFSVDYRDMEEAEAGNAETEGDIEKLNISKKGNWSEADNHYLFEASAVLNGLPVKDTGYFTKDDYYVAGGQILIGYKEDGICYLTTEGLFDPQGSDTQTLLPMEEILKALEEKYRNLLLEEEVVFDDVELIYYPILTDVYAPEYQLVPAWKFSDMSKPYRYEVFYNAVTGEELVF